MTTSGDYEADELGRGFDLVFLSAIIHSNSERGNRGLLRKCTDALKPEGQLVVQDFIVDEDRRGPPFAVLFALNMLVGTESGDTYTESEVRDWMREASLSNITRKDTEFGTTLLTGRK
jgi:SAM-dependent methyltransferase